MKSKRVMIVVVAVAALCLLASCGAEMNPEGGTQLEKREQQLNSDLCVIPFCAQGCRLVGQPCRQHCACPKPKPTRPDHCSACVLCPAVVIECGVCEEYVSQTCCQCGHCEQIPGCVAK